MKILSVESNPVFLSNAEVAVLLEAQRTSADGQALRAAACHSTRFGFGEKMRRYDLMVECGHYLSSVLPQSITDDCGPEETSAASRLLRRQDLFITAIQNYQFTDVVVVALLNAMPRSQVEVLAVIRSVDTSGHFGHEELSDHYELKDADTHYIR